MRIIFLLIASALSCSIVTGQQLKPGFDRQEMLEVMYVSARTGALPSYYSDSNKIPEPTALKMAYRSPVIGLQNLYEIWTSEQMAVISVRGTVKDTRSWLANLYAAMVPAKGTLRLNAADSFHYQLAEDPKAAVHAGWLLSTAYIARDLDPRLDSLCQAGIRDVIITGHSQGGGISYLLTAYLLNRRKQGLLPADMRIKTYSTAAPKPGNLYFAYEYEATTREGWAFNIINSRDWVPEMPFSVQTTADLNNVNPFTNIKDITSKQSFKNRLVMNTLYRRLSKHPEKASKAYKKYLGDKVSKQVGKTIDGYEKPEFYPSSHYSRAGIPIILVADENYSERFRENGSNFWIHHFHHPYIYLMQQMK